MIRIAKTFDSPTPERASTKWIVWDRSQTRIIAVGETFDAAKQAAALTGETSVILAKMSPSADGHGRRGGYSVAVFIAKSAQAAGASVCSK